MVGFMCYICGRLDPTEFFFGMQLTFPNPPHLLELKKAIEARAVQDGNVADGADFAVRDVEVLDLRLNMWVPLESRSQLYSGCMLTAIRDAASATSAGAVDMASKRPEVKVMAFALEGQRLFEALDANNAGVLTLKPLLKVLRHDVNYAIDFFSMIDMHATGSVNYQDFMTAYHKYHQGVWRELRMRLEHGGRLPGADGRSSKFMPRGTYIEQAQRALTDGGVGSPAGTAGDRSRASDRRTPPPRDSARSPEVANYLDDVDAVAADVLQSFDASPMSTATSFVSGPKSPELASVPKIKQPAATPRSPMPPSQGAPTPSEVASVDGLPLTGDAARDAANVERARKVVNALQSTMNKKKLEPTGKFGKRVMSAVRELRPKSQPAAGGGPGSPAGSAASQPRRAGTAASPGGKSAH